MLGLERELLVQRVSSPGNTPLVPVPQGAPVVKLPRGEDELLPRDHRRGANVVSRSAFIFALHSEETSD